MIEERMAAAIEQARANIRDYGFSVQHVFGGGGDPGFSYTMGLSKSRSHPEIFMVGMRPEFCHGLLSHAAREIASGSDFSRPCLSDLFLEQANVAFRPLTAASVDVNSGMGQTILGGPFEAVQMYVPDARGLFPWEEGSDPASALQQMLVEACGPLPGSEEALRSLM